MIRLLPLLLVLLVSTPAAAQAPACSAPPPVCAQASRVFRIASFDPEASAVLIASELLVTNRHVVADSNRVEVFSPSGKKMTAEVVPTSYPGDLILLKVPALKAIKSMATATASREMALYTIGADTGRGQIRVYPPGRVRLMPAKEKPLARLHHAAYSQPGNSGGALVDDRGRLVAIITSGGEGRNEAIPASEIAKLKADSGPDHQIASMATGEAYRKCSEALDAARGTRRGLQPRQVSLIKDQCVATNNRQLWDLAGQEFGRQRLFDDAVSMFARALDQDPNALNSMVSMVITLHLAGRYADEVKHLKRLVDILPADAEILRLGVQAGTWGGDKALAEKSLKLLELHHPRLAPLARDFIEKNPAPPRRKPFPQPRAPRER